MDIVFSKDLKVIEDDGLAGDYVFVKDISTGRQWIMSKKDLKRQGLLDAEEGGY